MCTSIEVLTRLVKQHGVALTPELMDEILSEGDGAHRRTEEYGRITHRFQDGSCIQIEDGSFWAERGGK